MKPGVMNAVGWTLLLALAAAAVGCAVGPRYTRPAVPVSAAFKEQPPAGWKTAQPSDAAVRGRWWEVFADPALSALEDQVSVSNQSLAQADARFRGARAAVQEARAGLFPTVSAGATASRSRASANRGSTAGSQGTQGSSGGGGTSTSYQLPVDFSWEADLWGRVRRTVEANAAEAQASAADVEATRLSLQAELAADWFQLHGLDEQKQLLDTTIAAFERALQINVNRHDQGIASGADVAQAQTQLEATRAQALDLDVSRTALEHAIAILAGKPPADLTIPRAGLRDAPPQVPVELPSDLLERRPDVAAAERRVAAANAQIGVAMAAYFPSLTVNASAGFESGTLSKLLSLPSRFWSVGPALMETLFDGGRRRAVTAQARASYDAAVAAYRENVLTALQEVEDNLAALRVLEAEATQEDLAVAAAERSLELARTRYTGGIASYLEVITAQNAALTAERASVEIRVRRMTASVSLIRALGGGWEGSGVVYRPAPMATSLAR